MPRTTSRDTMGRRMAAIAATVLVVLFVAACQSGPAQVAPVVEDLTYTRLASGARIVTGQLYNPSDVELAGAQIQVSLFDGNNLRIGSIGIPVQNIPPKGRVSFRQPIDSKLDVQAARVRSVIVL